MNFIHIAGNLGTDPEVRFTSTGKKVTTLKVASRSRRGKSGEDITIWWRVTVWGDQFDKMISYLKKGSAVMVYGDLHKPEIFTDREGRPQISMEITAAHLEFSPFGRSSNTSEVPSPSQKTEQPQKTEQHSSPFASSPTEEGTATPYMGFPPVSKIETEANQEKGETFDDEVPF